MRRQSSPFRQSGLRPAAPNGTEKQLIVTACEAFIRDVLKPRFLPQIRPTEWNYVVDIRGAWAARLDRMGPNRFDIYWMRHTGKWWRLYTGVTLVEALRILETDGILHPV